MSDDDEYCCPLCVEEIDSSDRDFLPCPCGYRICMWCWHHIRENLNGLCPACRTPYNADPHAFSAVDRQEVVKKNRERKQKEKQEKKAPERPVARPVTTGALIDRRHLHNYRVIQRNLVYVIGIPAILANEDLLRKPEYFGQYGKIGKTVIHRNHSSTHATISAYITFAYKEDAKASIQSMEGFWLDGHLLRASFGTTKYCNNFIRGVACNNPDCVYLHELGDDEDRFTKEEIQAGHSKLVPVPGTNQTIVTGKGGPSGTGKQPAGEPILPPPVFIQDIGAPSRPAAVRSATWQGGSAIVTNAAGIAALGLTNSEDMEELQFQDSNEFPAMTASVTTKASSSATTSTSTAPTAPTLAPPVACSSSSSASSSSVTAKASAKPPSRNTSQSSLAATSSSPFPSNTPATPTATATATASSHHAPTVIAATTTSAPQQKQQHSVAAATASSSSSVTGIVPITGTVSSSTTLTSSSSPTITARHATPPDSPMFSALPEALLSSPLPATSNNKAGNAAVSSSADVSSAFSPGRLSRQEKSAEAFRVRPAALAVAQAAALNTSASSSSSSGSVSGAAAGSLVNSSSINPTSIAESNDKKFSLMSTESSNNAKFNNNVLSTVETVPPSSTTPAANEIQNDAQQSHQSSETTVRQTRQSSVATAFNGFGNCAVFPVPMSSLVISIWSTVLRISASNSGNLDINPYQHLQVSYSELLELSLPPVDAVSITAWPKPLAHYAGNMQKYVAMTHDSHQQIQQQQQQQQYQQQQTQAQAAQYQQAQTNKQQAHSDIHPSSSDGNSTDTAFSSAASSSISSSSSSISTINNSTLGTQQQQSSGGAPPANIAILQSMFPAVKMTFGGPK